jgi:type IV secretory pathway VirB10-like protein
MTTMILAISSQPTWLPLAAGVDFIGIIIFIIVAVLSALSKKGEQTSDDEIPQKPVRRVPPRKPVTPTEPPPPLPDMAEQMRRFLAESRKPREPSQQAPAAPRSTSSKYVHPVKGQKTYTPPQATQTPIPQQSLVQTQIHQEVSDSMSLLGHEIEVSRTELSQTQAPTPSDESVLKSGEGLRALPNLKQAFVWTEILGKPRSLNRYAQY